MSTGQERADDVFLATLLRRTADRRGSLMGNSLLFGGLALAAACFSLIQPWALWFGFVPGAWARYCWRKSRAAGSAAGWPMDEPVRRAGHVRLASVRRVGAFDRSSILVRFSDDAGASLDLIVPVEQLATLREILPRRYPEAKVDLDRDLALPARAIARLGPDRSASD